MQQQHAAATTALVMRPVGAAGGRELADVLLHIPELGGVRGGVAAVHHAGRLEEVAVELVPRLTWSGLGLGLGLRLGLAMLGLGSGSGSGFGFGFGLG